MIESPLLPLTAGYVDGQWTAADSGETFAVYNPADGERLADVPLMGRAETERSIAAAHRAMQRKYSKAVRRDWLNSIERLLLDHKKALAPIITREQGKPLREALAEVDYAASFFRYFALQIDRLDPHVIEERIRGCGWEVRFRPAGVVGAITPWNFPLAMLAKKAAPALAAGCGVVAKPARETPLSALALAQITESAGVPAGIFNVVVGRAVPIANTLTQHSAVRIISFTGSTEIGRKLAAGAAPHIKRLAMELGGNAPFIVFDDADLEAAAAALIANKFRAGGQTCVCANRVYVQRGIADDFTTAVVEGVRRLRVGNGMCADTDIGPLINRHGFDKVTQHVNDAIRLGARRVAGDDPRRPAHDWGCYYPPTVLTDVRPEMRVCGEETFGPVVAIGEFECENDALALANGTDYGLAAYLFTRDPERSERAIAALEFGHVGVNTGMSPTAELPFGGVKCSGYGREGGLEGLLEFCEAQTVVRVPVAIAAPS